MALHSSGKDWPLYGFYIPSYLFVFSEFLRNYNTGSSLFLVKKQDLSLLPVAEQVQFSFVPSRPSTLHTANADTHARFTLIYL